MLNGTRTGREADVRRCSTCPATYRVWEVHRCPATRRTTAERFEDLGRTFEAEYRTRMLRRLRRQNA